MGFSKMAPQPTSRRLSTRLNEKAVTGDVVDTHSAPILALARGVAYAALFVAATEMASPFGHSVTPIWIASAILVIVTLVASSTGRRPEEFIAVLRQAPA